MATNPHEHLFSDVTRSALSYLFALLLSPFALWFLLGALQEAGVAPRLLYQNYSDLGYAGGYYLSIWLIMAVALYVGLFFILKAKWRFNVTPPWIVSGAVGAGLALVMVVATVVLHQTTDGTEKFSGKELEAAKVAVQAARNRDLGPFHMPWKYRVTAIHKARELNKCLVPQKTDDPDDLSYYSATIEGVWLFGIHETTEQPICQF